MTEANKPKIPNELLYSLVMATIPEKIAKKTIVSMAKMTLALRNGELSPEDIPPTLEEIVLVVTSVLAKEEMKAAVAKKQAEEAAEKASQPV